jgi:hypothetical protein
LVAVSVVGVEAVEGGGGVLVVEGLVARAVVARSEWPSIFCTVVWACGAPACACESCPTGQPCPALCSVPRANGTPGAHHLIVAEPGWPADIEEIYLRLRAELWEPEDARRAATRL